jgi:Domain of unknown function (DUF892)
MLQARGRDTDASSTRRPQLTNPGEPHDGPEHRSPPLNYLVHLIDELKDLYSAENQLVKALSKMASHALHRPLDSLLTPDASTRVIEFRKMIALRRTHFSSRDAAVDNAS